MLLPQNINKINKSTFGNKFTDRHIAYTNEKRKQINKQMMDIFVKRRKQKPLELPGLKYDKNSQDMRLLPGMPVIAKINNKSFDIYNNELYTIKKITDEKISLLSDDKVIELDILIKDHIFERLFYPAFCITVHRSQGSTFNHPYSIHEYEKFDERLKYVALSRATDINMINIV